MKTDADGTKITAPFVSVSQDKLSALTLVKSARIMAKRICTERPGNKQPTAVTPATVRKEKSLVLLFLAQSPTAPASLVESSNQTESAAESVQRINVWEQERFTKLAAVTRHATTSGAKVVAKVRRAVSVRMVKL